MFESPGLLGWNQVSWPISLRRKQYGGRDRLPATRDFGMAGLNQQTDENQKVERGPDD